jgi:outer membrane protein
MRFTAFALLALTAAGPALGQARDTSSATQAVLSLNEAISLARRNNPTFQQSREARNRAGAALRSAYGSFIPDVSTGFGTTFREGGQEIVAGESRGASQNILTSSGSIDVTAQYNTATFLAPKRERANLNAAEADVSLADVTLRFNVSTQYLNALQAQARAVLQDTLLANTQAQLELARARAAVGAATSLDVLRAEVAVGRQQVALVRERNSVEIEKVRLLQQMGVPTPMTVRLTTEFPVVEPTFSLNDLLATARRSNPALQAAHQRENSANVTVRQQQSSYLPTLSLRTGISGLTSRTQDIDAALASAQAGALSSVGSCLTADSLRVGAGLAARGNCSQLALTPAQLAARRSEMEKYPFSLAQSPRSFSVSVSLPIFDGLQREQRLQEANAFRNDARYRVRAQELQTTADVTAGHLNLVTAFRTVRMQEQNAEAARQALALSQERFRVGADTYVALVQARSDYEQAETDRINAVYEFHRAYAALESAVGRPLR